MIKDKKSIDILYKEYIKNKNRNWDLANNVLYDMCKQYPSHTNEDEIVAKIWLIGRSYAAAIERRKNAKGFSGDFYYDVVAPKMLKLGPDIDNKIESLIDIGTNDYDYKSLFISHSYLTNIFKSLTGLEKRSLASKYLHFHRPNAVFIYDSITSTKVRKLVRKNTQLTKQYKGYDDEYVDFCFRMFELQDYIMKKYNLKMTPREIDTFLLNAKL